MTSGFSRALLGWAGLGLGRKRQLSHPRKNQHQSLYVTLNFGRLIILPISVVHEWLIILDNFVGTVTFINQYSWKTWAWDRGTRLDSKPWGH